MPSLKEGSGKRRTELGRASSSSSLSKPLAAESLSWVRHRGDLLLSRLLAASSVVELLSASGSLTQLVDSCLCMHATDWIIISDAALDSCLHAYE